MKFVKNLVLVLFLAFFALGLSGCKLGRKNIANPDTAQIEKSNDYWVVNGNLYTTAIKYNSPGGREENKFVLTVKDGVIKTAKVEVMTKVDASIMYQKRFAVELPKLIVGKKISEIPNLDVVSGASLTTEAFNKALKSLKQQLEV